MADLKLKQLVDNIRNHNVKYIEREVDTFEHARQWVESGNTEIIFDVETSGLDPWSGATFCHDKMLKAHFETPCSIELRGMEVFRMGVGLVYPSYVEIGSCYMNSYAFKWIVNNILSNEKYKIIGHNIKFDIQAMFNRNFKLQNENVVDTLNMARLLMPEADRYTLKHLGLLLYGYSNKEITENKWDIDLKDWLRRNSALHTRAGFEKGFVNYSMIPEEILVPYLHDDIFHTYLIYQFLKQKMVGKLKQAFDLDMESLKVSIDMERRGIHIDRNITKLKLKMLKHDIIYEEVSLKEIAAKYGLKDFNPSSNKQIHYLLLVMGYSPDDMLIDGKVCVDKGVLSRLQEIKPSEFLTHLFNYRINMKLKTTYLEPFLERADSEGTIHANFKVADTDTGRFACSNPNLQNIPRPATGADEGEHNPVRACITAREGYSVYHFDFSQIELRAFAYFCDEHSMLGALARGEDLHEFTAELMLGSRDKEARQKAKSLNFGFIYGMGTDALARNLKMELPHAKQLLAQYQTTFPGLNRLRFSLMAQYKSKGYIEDTFGRRYYVGYGKEYVLVNRLIQGFCANLTKKALVEVAQELFNINQKFSRNLRKGEEMWELCHLINVIHDELVIEIPKWYTDLQRTYALKKIKNTMENLTPEIPHSKFYPKVECEVELDSWENKENVEL